MKLSRKKIIIAIIFLVLAIFGVWFFVFMSNQDRGEIIETTKNLFPFGQVTSDGRNPNIDSEQTVDGGNPDQTTEDPDINEEAGPRLRQISDFPTGGFAPLVRIDQEEVVETEINEEGNAVQIFRTLETENQYVRYSSISDGSIFESFVDPYTVLEEELIDNFVPNAEYAYFNNTGERVLFQYWNTENHSPESYLARIEKIEMEVEPCPFEFNPITLGEESESVYNMHVFLNRSLQTRIARTGINAPGNESSLATEATLTGIKNFQSLYQIDIDGQIGPATRTKMQEVCGEQQLRIAKEAFERLDRKYRISGFFLSPNITSVSMSPEGSRLFYLQEDSTGVIGTVRNLLDESRETIFESPFTEWTSQWVGEVSIELTTKPSYKADGYSYRLNADTGRYFKSISEKKGLTTNISPDNSKILVSESTETSPLQLSIFNRETKLLTPLDIETLPEKCVWAENNIDIYCGVPNALAYGNQYPDIWYQGVESFTDSLWKVNTETLEESLLSDFSREYGASIDIENIGSDSKNEYLYFIDKSTEFLWSYRLVNV